MGVQVQKRDISQMLIWNSPSQEAAIGFGVALEIIEYGDLIHFLGDSASYVNTALGLFNGFEMLQEPSQHETRIERVSKSQFLGKMNSGCHCCRVSPFGEACGRSIWKECWFGQVLGLTWCQEALDL